jgi:hypothetical protein
MLRTADAECGVPGQPERRPYKVAPGTGAPAASPPELAGRRNGSSSLGGGGHLGELEQRGVEVPAKSNGPVA